MISHSHKFILITPPKTGSTSLVTTLLDCIQTHPDRPQTCMELKHKKYGAYSRQNVECTQTYTLYGSVRNPYERMVSWWKYIKKKGHRRNCPNNFHDFIEQLKKHKRLSRG